MSPRRRAESDVKKKMERSDVAWWSLDFILRESCINPKLLKRVIPIIRVSNTLRSRFLKTVILRSLHNFVSTLSITTSILGALEALEELFRSDGSPVTAAMTSAYCAVAVECTLHHLRLDLCNHNSNFAAYLAAVNAIWRSRVCYMTGSDSGEKSLLFSPELERWSRDIEASILDSRVRERLLSVDSLKDAVAKLRVFLDEAWLQLGPSFIHVAAINALNEGNLEAQYHVKEVHMCGSAAAAGKEHRSTTIEVQKDRECSTSELQTSIRDPNSLKVNEEVHVENQMRDEDLSFLDVPCLDDIHDNEANVMQEDQTSLPQSRGKKPSLMEKNSTACTFEWDDSIDGLQEGTSNHGRLRLPSPRSRKPSPLKKYDYGSGSNANRRPKKKWSQLEEQTLRTAVDQFGRGYWKLILDSYKDIFEERTEVDLKDKWRNMTRYGGN